MSAAEKQKIMLQEIEFYSRLSLPEHNRFEELRRKQWEQKLSKVEHSEIMLFINRLERFNVLRIKRIMELAKLRNVEMNEVLEEVRVFLAKYEHY
ncbi:MAG: hypothetical protein AB8G22_06755 [Saprospiraceae bacterium]